jgi:hypothetical protein
MGRWLKRLNSRARKKIGKETATSALSLRSRRPAFGFVFEDEAFEDGLNHPLFFCRKL